MNGDRAMVVGAEGVIQLGITGAYHVNIDSEQKWISRSYLEELPVGFARTIFLKCARTIQTLRNIYLKLWYEFH